MSIRLPVGSVRLRGHADADFAPVAALFAETVANGSERGAIAVTIRGRTVVDLAGGMADPAAGKLWQPDTLACCFSVSKGVLSLLAHVMIERGLLDAQTRVAELWPEFASGGKDAITVADVMTHRAGLPAVSVPCERGDLYDWSRMTDLLAASQPVVPLGRHRSITTRPMAICLARSFGAPAARRSPFC